MIVSVCIKLEPDVLEALKKPVVGSGGFQSLLKTLNSRLRDDMLVLTLGDLSKITRYVQEYGGGGFQGRLRCIVNDIEQLGESVTGG